jgi:phage terminase small subunit
MTEKTKRRRSRKAKTAPAKPKKRKEPKLSKEEKTKLRIAAMTGASRIRRQEVREAELAKPVLPPPPEVCNDEELRFVTEYMKDLNGSRAMLRAGITDKPPVARVYASRYLDRPHVLMELARRRGELLAKNELTLERVLEELRRVGLSNLSDVVSWNDQGVLYINPKQELTADQLSAIASIEEEPGMFGSRLRVTMHKKVDALKDLRKHFSPGLAESRFTGGAGSGGGATIIIEGGPTGLEVTVHTPASGGKP